MKTLGNETADVAAKEAAEKQRTTGEPPRHITLKSGQITTLYKESKVKWKHERQRDKRNAKYLQSLTMCRNWSQIICKDNEPPQAKMAIKTPNRAHRPKQLPTSIWTCR